MSTEARPRERGHTIHYPEFVVWSAVFVGVPAWAVHLVFEAAIVGFTDEHHGWEWTMHAMTAFTAVLTLAGMAICLDLYRRAERARRDAPPVNEDDDASDIALSRFLGLMGFLFGVANLALILAEGSYVIFVRRGG
jgi:hypothetical protein